MGDPTTLLRVLCQTQSAKVYARPCTTLKCTRSRKSLPAAGRRQAGTSRCRHRAHCKAGSRSALIRLSWSTCLLGSAWMVREGWALPFVRYSSRYVPDEATAREARRGIWSGAFIAPWDWRHRNQKTVVLGAIAVPINAQAELLAPASAMQAPSPDCIIKGNINRKGERLARASRFGDLYIHYIFECRACGVSHIDAVEIEAA